MFVLSSVPRPENGKRCYVCRAADPNDPKDVCLRSPELVTPGAPCIPCKKKYCTIFRQEEKSTGTFQLGLYVYQDT
jgi:hypothetical protein